MLLLGDDLGHDLHVREIGPSYFGAFSAADEEDVSKGHVRTDVARDFFDPKDVALFNPVLFSAGSNHRVHLQTPVNAGLFNAKLRRRVHDLRALEGEVKRPALT